MNELLLRRAGSVPEVDGERRVAHEAMPILSAHTLAHHVVVDVAHGRQHARRRHHAAPRGARELEPLVHLEVGFVCVCGVS
jgi:hypothetical protein